MAGNKIIQLKDSDGNNLYPRVHFSPKEVLSNYIIEEYEENDWVVTKWANGRAEARMRYFKDTGAVTMTAIGNNYYSNDITWALPTGLFVDTDYHASFEFKSSGGPISTVRQESASTTSYVFRLQKSNNTTTSAWVKFRIIGRWK